MTMSRYLFIILKSMVINDKVENIILPGRQLATRSEKY